MALGTLGKSDLPAGIDTLLWTADEPAIIAVRLVNRGADEVKLRVAITSGGAPAAADYIEYDTPLGERQVLENSNLAVSQGDKVYARTDIATVSARAHGIPAS